MSDTKTAPTVPALSSLQRRSTDLLSELERELASLRHFKDSTSAQSRQAATLTDEALAASYESLRVLFHAAETEASLSG